MQISAYGRSVLPGKLRQVNGVLAAELLVGERGVLKVNGALKQKRGSEQAAQVEAGEGGAGNLHVDGRRGLGRRCLRRLRCKHDRSGEHDAHRLGREVTVRVDCVVQNDEDVEQPGSAQPGAA
eukprot:6212339-Pleurochrysis_carterae.AAC.4